MTPELFENILITEDTKLRRTALGLAQGCFNFSTFLFVKMITRKLNTRKLNTRKLNTRKLNTFQAFNNRDIYYTSIFLVRTAHNLCI